VWVTAILQDHASSNFARTVWRRKGSSEQPRLDPGWPSYGGPMRPNQTIDPSPTRRPLGRQLCNFPDIPQNPGAVAP
jgi:hypothetical protein